MHIDAHPDPSWKNYAAVNYMVWCCLLAIWPLEFHLGFLVEMLQFAISAKNYVN